MRFVTLGALVVLCVACAPAGPTPEVEQPTQPLLPYSTATISPTLSNQAELLPTPTPQLYEVQQGDTLFSIAAVNQITVDQLLAANPGVDPFLLVPGTQLVIPLASEAGTVVPALPSPTPVPVSLGAAQCYATAAGELWCLALAQNENAFAIENVIGVVQLLDADGEPLATLQAVAPLNRVEAGDNMPLVAYAAAPPSGWASAQAQLLSAYRVPANDTYYLQAEVQETDVDIADDGLSARVLGEVALSGGGSAGTIWVAAIAYDSAGQVVGVRRWESSGETEFYFLVYSLGPQIATVELVVEARP